MLNMIHNKKMNMVLTSLQKTIPGDPFYSFMCIIQVNCTVTGASFDCSDLTPFDEKFMMFFTLVNVVDQVSICFINSEEYDAYQ